MYGYRGIYGIFGVFLPTVMYGYVRLPRYTAVFTVFTVIDPVGQYRGIF